jgi:hypothetical protein
MKARIAIHDGDFCYDDTMQRLFARHQAKWIVLVLANLLYFALINPESSKSLVLFGGFGLLAIDFFLVFKLILTVIGRLAGRPTIARNRVSLLGTGVVIVLLALQSIGQLSVRDAAAVVCVGVIFMFYSSYYRFGHRS